MRPATRSRLRRTRPASFQHIIITGSAAASAMYARCLFVLPLEA
jgi:hypothetical protein